MTKQKLKEIYTNTLNCNGREDLLSAIREGDPRTFVIYHEKVMAYAGKVFTPPQEVYTPPFTNFNHVPWELQDWVAEELPKRDRPKTLILWGPSRTAKTSWAQSLVSRASPEVRKTSKCFF